MTGQIQNMAENAPESKRERTGSKPGRVWLVGAGPGAPDLITKRGYDLLQKADVVVYDALILPETLEMIPENVEKIYVGKRAGAHSVPQEEIEQILIREAGLGKRVVRLKGGDPFVFGRGGEEALALAECGILCEIVPGVTSAVAVPETFGIPVTHRGLATSFTVITGHGQQKGVNFSSAENYFVDYEALVRTGGTLVFLMGLSAAYAICRGLMDAGMEATVPAAALSKGTTAAQRMVLSTVGSLAEDIRVAELQAPAILVVGEVCALSPALSRSFSGDACCAQEEMCTSVDGCSPQEKETSLQRHIPYSGEQFALRRFEKTKLSAGCGDKIFVVVTRQAEKAGAFSRNIRAMGLGVWELPAIRIQRPEKKKWEEAKAAVKKLCASANHADWLIFTSGNGVDAFIDLLSDTGLDMRSLFCEGVKKFAAVGSKTAEALQKHGIRPDLVPEEYNGAALGEALGVKIEEDTGGSPAKYRKYTWNDGKENPENSGKGAAKYSPEVSCWFFGASRTDGGLEAALASHGIPLKTVPVYETVSALRQEDVRKLAGQISEGNGHFLFTFTSASCVKNLAAAMAEADVRLKPGVVLPGLKTSVDQKDASDAELLSGQIAICIGEKTANAARKVGMRVVVSKESTEESMLEEVCRVAAELASEN